jgi:hypothetical protein
MVGAAARQRADPGLCRRDAGGDGHGLRALLKSYGLPRQWDPRPGALLRLANRNLPLAGADAVEWGTRKLDLFILGTFAPAEAVGIYYVAQQVATLPQKLKTSFEPILGPVITRNLRENNLGRSPGRSARSASGSRRRRRASRWRWACRARA